MSKVSIVKCNDYQTENVQKAVKLCIEHLGGINRFVKPGNKVLIKPNLLSPRPPERAKTTHPEVIRAVIRIVKKAGGVPHVGDSPGGNVVTTETGQTLLALEKYWVETGMKKVCEEEKVELVCFETGGVEKFEIKDRKYTPELFISKLVLSYDVVISVPKLKTHGMVLYTGAIKNMYGCVPGIRKTIYHKQAIHPDNFSQLLVDIVSVIKPRLCIMDAVVGMDGQGPSAGRKVNIGAVLASDDFVAIDSVGAKIFGFKPEEIPTNKIAYREGLGEIDLNKIDLLGDNLNDVIIKDPLKPSNAILRKVPQFVMDLIGKFIWARPKINTKKCTVCKVCVDNCPVKTIVMKDKYPYIEYKKCINCLCCHELCNYGAIDIEMSWIVRQIRK